MKVLFEAPQAYRDPYFKYTKSRSVATALVPDPNVWIELDKYPKLKYISTPSTGMNHIDLLQCAKRGIVVYSLRDDMDALNEIRASSEFTFQLILHALHRPFQQYMRYDRNDAGMRGYELYGKTVGIIGYGRIGKNIAKWVTAFGAYWDYHDPKYKNSNNMIGLFRRCDIVLISCSLNEETRGMITGEHLNAMKEGAILVNTARAEIIDEDALVSWAKKGQNIYAADVLHGEVFGKHKTSELLKLPNCIITPHIAGTTYESQEKAARIALNLLKRIAQ